MTLVTILSFIMYPTCPFTASSVTLIVTHQQQAKLMLSCCKATIQTHMIRVDSALTMYASFIGKPKDYNTC